MTTAHRAPIPETRIGALTTDAREIFTEFLRALGFEN